MINRHVTNSDDFMAVFPKQIPNIAKILIIGATILLDNTYFEIKIDDKPFTFNSKNKGLKRHHLDLDEY